MSQFLYKGVQVQRQGDYIQLRVVISLFEKNFNLDVEIDPLIPFNLFISGIIEQIIVSEAQAYAYYEEALEYKLDNRLNILRNDNRTLENLGFQNNSTLYAGNKFRKQKIDNKRIYEVLVDLKNKMIQLFVQELKTTPVSCVFHDILVQLIQNYELNINQPLVFFINDIEVQPFDIRLIQDFQTNEGIRIKIVVPRKQANQYQIEKYQFALNKSKQIKICQSKIIMIELINQMRMQFFTQTNISLQEIFEKIKVDFQLSNSFVQYQINNKTQYGLYNIYAINNFKFEIYKSDLCYVFKLVGDFYQKFTVKGFIDGNNYVIEETMPMNTSMIEVLKGIKFKIFGPKQNNYTEEIIGQYNDLAEVNYSTIKK